MSIFGAAYSSSRQPFTLIGPKPLNSMAVRGGVERVGGHQMPCLSLVGWVLARLYFRQSVVLQGAGHRGGKFMRGLIVLRMAIKARSLECVPT
jgi:hypothetical protein